jgi:hypothetical protein
MENVNNKKETATIRITYCPGGSCSKRNQCLRYTGHWRFKNDKFRVLNAASREQCEVNGHFLFIDKDDKVKISEIPKEDKA